MIKAIIIDDEKIWPEMISNLLNKHCPQVAVIEKCGTAAEGIKAIHQNQPDVVFTDIEMPGMNGFEMLKKFSKIDFDVIFITASDKHAVKAFKCSALDYLLKPIDPAELIAAIEKVEQKKIRRASVEQIDLFFSAFKSKMTSVKRVALPSADSIIFVAPENIIRCESDSNYTLFVMSDKQKTLIAKTLKEAEEILHDFGFIRVHHSHLINPDYIEKYIREDGGYVLMKDGSHITVSRSYKDTFAEHFLKL